MHFLEQKIRAAREKGRYAFIPFLTYGYPDEDSFWRAMFDLDALDADIIEIGVPFSDPVADGPVVEQASRDVLADGVTLKHIISNLDRRNGALDCGIVLMGYLNPFLQYGFEQLAADAADVGVHGIIIPDLPYEEAAPYREMLAKHDIALVALVGPNTSLERMKLYADVSEGYAYVVSVMGLTGVRESVAPMVADTMTRAREAFKIPLALGFGFSRPEQVDVLPPEARPDAVVIGSALMMHIKKGLSPFTFIDD